MQRIVHPSKEQVRAYMVEREAARRPPPTPAEIRRQLGWHLEADTPHMAALEFYQIPTIYLQLVGRSTLDWLLMPLSARGRFY